ncbi:hypothetical protein [Rhodohalobacter sp.]|uniref:hypothetical protein n=1 Tax=Rhodohalobacter sp. TaxID=1974210 RepID=UPI002ACDC85C|nr:hypothetical protein [Rhodohalobacter sp.]MDZ7757513.1 hypothetical protein [Rhodohalobacter sp.]
MFIHQAKALKERQIIASGEAQRNPWYERVIKIIRRSERLKKTEIEIEAVLHQNPFNRKHGVSMKSRDTVSIQVHALIGIMI